MEELQEYTVIIGGLPHTLLLDQAAADRYGAAATPNNAKDTKAAPPAATKARTTANK